jgi:hypothetical protein
MAPKVDMSETKDAVLVKAEIPGLEQKTTSMCPRSQGIGEANRHRTREALEVALASEHRAAALSRRS